MPILTGKRLGPYEILSAIGAGGMGEVYRARDTRLNRDVAIKVLPEVFADDADRMARFEREARVLAALNHPHIAAIYGVEESNSVAHWLWSWWMVRRWLIASPIASLSAWGRTDTSRRSAGDRQANCRSAGICARQGRDPPGPEAREHQSDRRWHGQGARLRLGQSIAG